ncbi:rhomboid family intramembrane serine protease [Chryseobacterium ginsenosidimutans]|uniref:rhomboid family intramembrane serine protease n=1 Tax=Chryseobacterium ginsenosidimutans TaxID=687846 RepID=UPI0031DB3991
MKTSRDSLIDLYCIIAWITITIPLVISQQYLITSSGKLTRLKTITEINKSAPTKYYSLQSYYIDKNHPGIFLDTEVGGRNNENFALHIYAAVPIFEKPSDTASSIPLSWLAVEYSEKISNRLTANEKETKFREFTNKSELDFRSKNLSDFKYLDRLGNSDQKEGLTKAVENNMFFKNKSPDPIILKSINEPFENRNGNKVKSLILSITICPLVWLIIILIPKIDQRHLTRIKAGKPDRKAQREVKEFLEFLIPQEGLFMTLILIYINVAIFLLMSLMGYGFFSFEGQDLLKWGANFGPLTKNGEWWRLLTCTFLHGGAMHLFTNMYGLLFVGMFLEPLLGRKYFLIIYLINGILASLVSLFWHDATVSIGASGAIFGMYGLFISFMLFKIFTPEFSKAFLLSTLVFVGINLLMGLTGGIDNAAHIGGLLSGFIIGILMTLFIKKEADPEGKN